MEWEVLDLESDDKIAVCDDGIAAVVSRDDSYTCERCGNPTSEHGWV